jgi:cytochrome c biogenesis protein|uniref:Cytochrome c biogenesis protein CcsB n=1 Tax=Galdieria yellowstonensis TaxID=3028027 RepID=A0A9Y1I375_9RHOD|nr:c-type cytochrome biogenensis protein [Galdieria yellowstonensis]WDA99502.1 c-type cytochrome biogenensis protein [Galdieria yellowstonensis]
MFKRKKNYIVWLLLKFSSNLNFAVILLFTIALTSVLGTIIEQNQSIEYYKVNYSESHIPLFSWRIILFLGLHKIYTSWWYICLLILLGTSLLSCTLLNQLPLLNLAKIIKFYANLNTLKNFPLIIEIKNNTLSKCIYHFLQKRYIVIQHKDQLYLYNGLFSKIAPIFVHISIILVLLGAISGFLMGFTVQEMIVETENFHLQNVINAGPLSKIPQNLFLKVNKFWIDYNNDGSISQFFSDIFVYDNLGNKLCEKTISVNNPLIYKNITFYQTDWNLQAIRLDLNNMYLELPLIEVVRNNSKIWISQIQLDHKIFYLVVEKLNNIIYLYDENKDLIDKLKINEDKRISLDDVKNSVTLKVKKIIPSTGIQIKYDPGVGIVYLGFFFLMLSTIFSYFSFNQIWLLTNNKNSIYLTGQTNRAKISFKQYLLNITREM